MPAGREIIWPSPIVITSVHVRSVYATDLGASCVGCIASLCTIMMRRVCLGLNFPFLNLSLNDEYPSVWSACAAIGCLDRGDVKCASSNSVRTLIFTTLVASSI